MYTTTYPSSPVRTSANYQTQTYHSSNSMNSRRSVNPYSSSSSALNAIPMNIPTSPKNYSTNYNLSPPRNSTTSYRSYGNNDFDTYRSTNSRAYSYDDLLNNQQGGRSTTSSVYNSRNTLPYGSHRQQQQQQSNEYDDDIVVKSTDLPAAYEQDMIDLLRTAFRKYEITNQRELAGYLKRSADKRFAPCWHCIVGRQFSSYVTHEMNGFIYFTKGPLSILLFKSGA